MKAAVISRFGDTPKLMDFPDPVVTGKDEKLIIVKASALENFDKMVANGIHYSSKQAFPGFPAIVGHSGIGLTEEGKTVGFAILRAPYGSFAEKTVARNTVPIPDGIDAAIAAVMPAAILTSYFPLKYTARMEKGENVLINGATGVSGRIAIQLARMLGAKRVIGTGRNQLSLRLLKELGADETIDLNQSDDLLISTFRNESEGAGFDIVIDFIWGHPAELIMKSLVPTEAGFPKKRIRYIHVGEKAGSSISLSGEMLRTSGLEIYGAGKIPPEAIPESINQAWEWIKENKFHMDIERVPLSEIENAWQRRDLEGKRIVIVP